MNKKFADKLRMTHNGDVSGLLTIVINFTPVFLALLYKTLATMTTPNKAKRRATVTNAVTTRGGTNENNKEKNKHSAIPQKNKKQRLQSPRPTIQTTDDISTTSSKTTASSVDEHCNNNTTRNNSITRNKNNNNNSTTRSSNNNKTNVVVEVVSTNSKSAANTTLTTIPPDQQQHTSPSSLVGKVIVSNNVAPTENLIATSTTQNKDDSAAASSTQQQQFLVWLAEQGSAPILQDEKDEVQRHVRKHLFPKVKFIRNDIELQYTGMSFLHNLVVVVLVLLTNNCCFVSSCWVTGENCIAHLVCTPLKIAPFKWDCFKEVVRETIRVRRACCTTALKREFIGKYYQCLALFVMICTHNICLLLPWFMQHCTAIVNDSNATQMYTSKNMLPLRQSSNGGQNEAYIFFCEHFLKCIVGNTTFNKMQKLNLKLSEIATPSDEALGLLLLENNEFKWLSEAQNKGNRSNQDGNWNNDKPKYTSGGRSKGTTKGLTRRYGGWKSDGIKRFNELIDLVKEDRLKNGGWFDEIMKARVHGVGNKKIQEKEKDDEEWVLAKNDLFDDVVVIPTRQVKQIELNSQKNAADDDAGDVDDNDDDDGGDNDGGDDDDEEDSLVHAEAV
jgi:hypothetical protein